jgi:hypothetical protein
MYRSRYAKSDGKAQGGVSAIATVQRLKIPKSILRRRISENLPLSNVSISHRDYLGPPEEVENYLV